MKRIDRLKPLCVEILRYVGTGYKYIKFATVSDNKIDRLPEILNKVSMRYNSNLGVGQRQYRRRKGIANYAVLNFKNTIIILRTDGEHQDGENEFKLIEKSIEFRLTPFLGLVLHKDERQTHWTFRLSPDTFHNIKGQIQLAFEKNDGKLFHTVLSQWKGFPHYKGIGKQKTSLNLFIKNLKRQYHKTWSIK